MRAIWKAAVLNDSPVVFFVTGEDCKVRKPGSYEFSSVILQYLNPFLSNGIFPGLFTPDELEGLLLEMSTGLSQQTDANSEMKSRFERNVRVIFCFNSRSSALLGYFENYPQLLRRSYVNHIDPWSQDALTIVAEERLGEVVIPEHHLSRKYKRKKNSRFHGSSSKQKNRQRRGSDKIRPTRTYIVESLANLHMVAAREDKSGYVTPRTFSLCWTHLLTFMKMRTHQGKLR